MSFLSNIRAAATCRSVYQSLYCSSCGSTTEIRIAERIDTQAMSDSRPCPQEEVWTAHDFRTEIIQDFAVTHAQYLSLKQNWIGTPVKPRDPHVTDKLLRSWGMSPWKQYVLDRYLTNY